jgi:hypothetical protein
LEQDKKHRGLASTRQLTAKKSKTCSRTRGCGSLRAEAELRAVRITDAAQVASVVEKFRKKYGARHVTKYYSKFDVAVLAPVR